MLSRLQTWTAVIGLAAVVTATACGESATASAAAPEYFTGSQAPRVGTFVAAPRGPAVVTGNMGSMATVTLPGGGEGLLENNSNGTSTLISPNGFSEAVPTPR
jgi:hypothetical protein